MTAEEIQEMYENLNYFKKKCERLELQAKDDAQEIMILTEKLKQTQDALLGAEMSIKDLRERLEVLTRCD